MITKDELISRLTEKWPNANQLRKEHPGLEYFLRGEFTEDPFKIVEEKGGVMVCRTLNQGLPENPFVGVYAPGTYREDTWNHNQTLFVLDGLLFVQMKYKKEPERPIQESKLGRYGAIITPTNVIVDLDARSLVYFFLQNKTV